VVGGKGRDSKVSGQGIGSVNRCGVGQVQRVQPWMPFLTCLLLTQPKLPTYCVVSA